MKRIKSMLALALTLVMVVTCGQMVGVSKVEAASNDVTYTLYNAQRIDTELVKSLVADEAGATNYDNITVYAANDATVMDVKVNSSNTEIFYGLFNWSGTGDAEPLVQDFLSAGRYNIGQMFKSNGANYAIILNTKLYTSDIDGGCLIFSQTEAKRLGLPVEGTRTDNGTCTMHRLYNPNSGEHFYTANDTEKNYLVSLGWKYEGIGWTAPAYSGTPVYRVYNPNAGDHHYTTSVAEKNNLVSLGWKDEGIGWYSNELGTTTLHRLYNPNATGAGAHHYTTNAGEATNLQNLGWRYEGTAWYGL